MENAVDISWLDDYLSQDADLSLWTRMRSVRSYAFETPSPVITIYRRTLSRKGVIVLNLLPGYIESQMYADEPEGMPYVAILSESGELLLENEQRPFGDSVSLDSLRGGEEGSFTMKLDGENYIVNRLFSGSCGWTYLSLVPERVLYQLPTQLAWTLCLVLTLCFILGLLLVLQFTSRSYRQMQNIMELFRAAEEGRPLPTLSERGFRDEYSILGVTV